MLCALCAGVTEKHFKEKLPRVLGFGNTTPDAATMTTGVRGLMFGDYMVPGDTCVIACLTPLQSPHALHSTTSYTLAAMSDFHMALKSFVGAVNEQ